jgi:hypothetical protein
MRGSVTWIALALIWSVGCAKAPFTTAVLERFGLTANDLGRVQFFVSETVVLERELTSQTRVTEGAELRFRDNMQTEIIEVSEHTPCVVLRVEGDYLLLGFSPKDVNASLWFAAQPLEQGQSAPDGRRYALVALDNPYEEGAEPFAPRWSKGFLVNWSGKKYHIASGRSAYLLYELSDDSKRRKIERSPPGWRLSDRAPRKDLAPSPPNPPTEAGDAPAEPPEPSSVEVEP